VGSGECGIWIGVGLWIWEHGGIIRERRVGEKG
jgi:hypothetical protein